MNSSIRLKNIIKECFDLEAKVISNLLGINNINPKKIKKIVENVYSLYNTEDKKNRLKLLQAIRLKTEKILEDNKLLESNINIGKYKEEILNTVIKEMTIENMKSTPEVIKLLENEKANLYITINYLLPYKLRKKLLAENDISKIIKLKETINIMLEMINYKNNDY